MSSFMNENFLLKSELAQTLYHGYAAKMPVIDYHCHVPPQAIAEDWQFENITQPRLAYSRPRNSSSAVLKSSDSSGEIASFRHRFWKTASHAPAAPSRQQTVSSP